MMALSEAEICYVRGLKRREREEVHRALEPVRKSLTTVEPLRIRVLRSKLEETAKLKIFEELRTSLTDKYLNWVLKVLTLPLGRYALPSRPRATAQEALASSRAVMDGAVEGHETAKHEVLKLALLQQRSGPDVAAKQSYALGFEGPPGCGKTLFVKEGLVPALGRPVVNIPLGGATDVSFLLGHVYTYEGAKEGALAAGLIEAKCMNPIFYFDEVDKVSETERGREIGNLLVHLIDPTANGALRDRFFHGIDLDFSACTFIFSYNDASKVNPVLLDRIKRIPITTPTEDQRVHIIRKHVLPRVRERLNTKLDLSDELVAELAERCNAAEGMRQTERLVEHLVSSALVREALSDKGPRTSVIENDFARSLLPKKTADAAPTMMYT